MNSAFNQGRADFESGRAPGDTRYPLGSREHASWREGYRAASAACTVRVLAEHDSEDR